VIALVAELVESSVNTYREKKRGRERERRGVGGTNFVSR
jgi:hypothetical protein